MLVGRLEPGGIADFCGSETLLVVSKFVEGGTALGRMVALAALIPLTFVPLTFVASVERKPTAANAPCTYVAAEAGLGDAVEVLACARPWWDVVACTPLLMPVEKSASAVAPG